MIAAGIMLIGILLLSIKYSNRKLNTSPVKTTVQPISADQEMLENDFPFHTIGISLYMLY